MSGPIVLVLSWNRRDQTRRCLASLARQRPSEPEVVVVDNGSTDGSPELIAREFPRARLIALDQNQGYCGGLNHGLRLAAERGATAAVLLNNDTELDPECIATLAAASGSAPAVLGPKVFFRSEPELLQSAGARIQPRCGRVRHLGYRRRDRGQFDRPPQRDALSGCCLWINRSAMERVGLLDESYFAYFEDVEYCLRAGAAGARIELVPSARLWHEGSASLGGEGSPIRLYYSVRNHLRVLDQHRPLSGPGRALRHGMILSLSAAYLVFSSRVEWRAGLRALRHAWTDFTAGRSGVLDPPTLA